MVSSFPCLLFCRPAGLKSRSVLAFYRCAAGWLTTFSYRPSRSFWFSWRSLLRCYAFNPGSPFGLHGLLRFAQRLWMMTPAFTFDLIFTVPSFPVVFFFCFSHHVPHKAADAPAGR
jgi:hypothetical protein